MSFHADSANTYDSKDPHGLGDPNDKRLRRVETEVMVPKIMRDRAKELHCTEAVAAFQKCCKAYSLGMVVMCRKENSELQKCLTQMYENAEFKEECKQIYLKERSEYRRTGIPSKHRIERVPSS